MYLIIFLAQSRFLTIMVIWPKFCSNPTWHPYVRLQKHSKISQKLSGILKHAWKYGSDLYLAYFWEKSKKIVFLLYFMPFLAQRWFSTVRVIWPKFAQLRHGIHMFGSKSTERCHKNFREYSNMRGNTEQICIRPIFWKKSNKIAFLLYFMLFLAQNWFLTVRVIWPTFCSIPTWHSEAYYSL